MNINPVVPFAAQLPGYVFIGVSVALAVAAVTLVLRAAIPWPEKTMLAAVAVLLPLLGPVIAFIFCRRWRQRRPAGIF